MQAKPTLPRNTPLLLLTEQGALCGMILEEGRETVEVVLLFQQGGIPWKERLPVIGAAVRINRQAILGWASLQPLAKGEEDLWSLALARQCGVGWHKTYTDKEV